MPLKLITIYAVSDERQKPTSSLESSGESIAIDRVGTNGTSRSITTHDESVKRTTSYMMFPEQHWEAHYE